MFPIASREFKVALVGASGVAATPSLALLGFAVGIVPATSATVEVPLVWAINLAVASEALSASTFWLLLGVSTPFSVVLGSSAITAGCLVSVEAAAMFSWVGSVSIIGSTATSSSLLATSSSGSKLLGHGAWPNANNHCSASVNGAVRSAENKCSLINSPTDGGGATSNKMCRLCCQYWISALLFNATNKTPARVRANNDE